MPKKNQYTGVEIHGKKIRITFRWRCQRKREVLPLSPTPANLKAAANYREEIQDEIRRGVFDYGYHFPDSKTVKELGLATSNASADVIPTFSVVAHKWLQSCAHLAKGTQGKYKSDLERFWLPEFGRRDIRMIKYSEIAAYVGGIEWTSPKVRNNALIPLRAVFGMAHVDDLIKNNPAEKIQNQKMQKSPPDPLTLKEAEQVVDYLRNMHHEQVANYFEFAFFSGLRVEEQIALRWSDVHLDKAHPFIRVQHARTKGEEKATKTYKIRDVHLNTRARQALERQQPITGSRKRNNVFHNPVTDEPWNDNGKAQRIRYWNPALERLGIRHRKASSTRHTYATMMLMGGNNPAYAANQMGHSIHVFLSVYARWINLATQHEERSKIENFIKQGG